MDQSQRLIANTLFWSFWAVYVLGAIGTLGMLFFDLGSVRDSERGVLVNAFVAETAVAIGALFYSVFRLRRGQQGQAPDHASIGSEVDAANRKKSLERVEAESHHKDELIRNLQAQLKVERQPPSTRYRDAIVALCSPNGDTEISDILKGLLLDPTTDRDRVKDVLDEIGRMKRTGDLYVYSSLRPTSVRLKT